jgi:hypothetical protein
MRRVSEELPRGFSTTKSTKPWCKSSLSSSTTGRGPPVRPSSSELLSSPKKSKSLSRMEVDVKQIALQKITVRVIVVKTKIRIVKALVGLADLPAERQKNVSILIERDKFGRIPKIVALRRIRQKTPILFITGKRIQWARKRRRFFLSCHSIPPTMTTSNTSTCEILNAVCTLLSPVL